MSLAQKSITVIGGNGFLGKRICQAAILKGFNVTSLSRSGQPPLSISHNDHDWVSQVKWEKLDIFDPKSYAKKLAKTDVLVHTLGILLESNYKTTLNQNSNLCDILDKLQEHIMPNPMAKTVNNSYDQVNRLSAILAATNFLKASKKPKDLQFVYISADRGFPGLPSGYINSKRAAELELLDMSNLNKNFKTLIARPGFMYDEDVQGDLRSNFSTLLNFLNQFNHKALNGLLSGLIRPTVSTQRVASKIIDAVEHDKNGILLLEQILN